MKYVNILVELLRLLDVKYTTKCLINLCSSNPYRNSLYGLSMILSSYNIDNVAIRLKDKQQGMIFTLEEAQSLSNVADVCIAKKDWIRETVNERITWSKNYISGKAVANYIVQNL